jgi:hypothetical protein
VTTVVVGVRREAGYLTPSRMGRGTIALGELG